MTKIPDAFSEFGSWLKLLCRYGKIEDFFLCDYNVEKSGLQKFRVTCFTKDHQYHISCHFPEKAGGDGYLGCIVETRKPRAGEKWNRGNDLADGSYSKETFDEIVRDILAYELVKVIKPSKNENVDTPSKK